MKFKSLLAFGIMILLIGIVTASDHFRWCVESTAPTYSGGQTFYQSTAAPDPMKWTSEEYDFEFRIYGGDTIYERYERVSCSEGATMAMEYPGYGQSFTIGNTGANVSFTATKVGLRLNSLESVGSYGIIITGTNTSNGPYPSNNINHIVLAKNSTWDAGIVTTGIAGVWYNITLPNVILSQGVSYFLYINTTSNTHYSVSFNYPINNTKLQIINLSCNATVGSSALSNMTIHVLNSVNEIVFNHTQIITGVTNSTNWTITTLTPGVYQWSCEVADASNSILRTGNRTFIYTHKENSQIFNSSTYETASESFTLNWSYSSPSYSAISANLSYNGTIYPATKYGTGTNIRFIKTMEIPLTQSWKEEGNRSFYWEIFATNLSGQYELFNSTFQNQTVRIINLSRCSGTNNVPFINFTFKDETLGTSMGAVMDLTSWTYYLGSGSLIRSLYETTTSESQSYAFCFSPADKTMSENLTFQYSNQSFPQRQYFRSGTLTNSTLNQLLYLLGSSSGIYSTFITNNNANAALGGVTVQVERQFGGVWTLISQGTTDSAGSVTFWLNPNYDHRVTATKTGYTSTTVTIRPTQSVYTIIMGSGASNATYSSILEGITYSIYPAEDFLNSNTTYLFGFNVNSSLCNLDRYKIELYLNNYSSLGYTEGTNACGSNISLSQNTFDFNIIYARYYIDIGTGYYDISPSAYPIQNITAGEGSIYDAIRKLINTRTNIRDNYGQLWWLFFLMFVCLAVLCFSTGAELTNPGIVLPIVLLLIFIFSFMGFFTMNLTGTPTVLGNSWFDKYAIFVIALCFTLGFTFRRLSE